VSQFNPTIKKFVATVGKRIAEINPERVEDFKTGIKDFIAFIAKNYSGFKF